MSPEQYDKDTTQTDDDLCRICYGKRRKSLKILTFCFWKTGKTSSLCILQNCKPSAAVYVPASESTFCHRPFLPDQCTFSPPILFMR